MADIGGGPGRYALWLAECGYQVVHRDFSQAEPLAGSPEANRAAHPAVRRAVLATARALERVPELIGIGPHLLAAAHSA